MAEKLESFEQVWNFITQIDPASAAKVAETMRQINETRRQDHLATEKQISADFATELNDRVLLAESADQDFSKGSKDRMAQELKILEKLREANDKYYADVLKIAKSSTAEERQLRAQLMTDEERMATQAHQKNEDQIKARRKQLEGKEKEGGGGMHLVDRIMGQSKTDDIATKTMKGGFDLLAGKLKPLAFIQQIAGSMFELMKLGLEQSRQRDLQQIALLSGSQKGFRFASADDQQAQSTIQRNVLESINEEMRGKGLEAMGALSRSAPGAMFRQGGGETGATQEATFHKVINAADAAGVSWNEAAEIIGVQSRRFGVSIDDAADQLTLITETGRELMLANKGQALDLTRFRDNVMTSADALKEYNVTLPQATHLITRFAFELDKGQLSIQDLITFVKGQTTADPGRQAFLMQNLIKEFGGESAFLQKAQSMAGGDPIALQQIFRQIMEQNPDMAGKMGGKAGDLRNEMLDLITRFTEKTADKMGGGTSDQAQLRTEFLRQQLETGIFQDIGANVTLQGRQSLRRGGGAAASQQAAEMMGRGMEAVAPAQAAVEAMRDSARTWSDQILTPVKSAFDDFVSNIRTYSHELGDMAADIARSRRGSGNMGVGSEAAAGSARLLGTSGAGAASAQHRRAASHRQGTPGR